MLSGKDPSLVLLVTLLACSRGADPASDAGAQQATDANCSPNCTGRQCGEDGCGGSCGSCGLGTSCQSGACVAQCKPHCFGRACGDDLCGGSCGACGAQETCQDGSCATTPCDCDHGCCASAPFRNVTSKPGLAPSDPPEVFCSCSARCSPAAGGPLISDCLQDSDCCSDAYCELPDTTPVIGFCAGGCWKQQCSHSYGLGGCCASDPYCVGWICEQLPGVAGVPCADDVGCAQGGACISGVCKSPGCGEKQCGSDGAGGSCGTCPGDQTCDRNGQCAPCVPSCDGRSCGPDGCGGSCGQCSNGQSCDTNGQCACTPDCSGKVCGDGGCGISCGTCAPGWLCAPGQVCAIDANSCDPVSGVGCMGPNGCLILSSEQPFCALTGTGGQGSACSTSADCQGGYACFDGTCRKICLLSTGAGCAFGSSCNGVRDWIFYGACT
jgi:hypothetical protein